MDISTLFKEVKQLPILPIVLLELMESFSNDNTNISEISKKIGMDQTLSAKVIRMANSAVYRRGKEVNSIAQAVIRLGFNQVRSIVVASTLSNVFPNTPGFDKNKFWKDTFRIACIAKTFAKHTKVEPETAFTCAMMHNIGELLLQILRPKECSLVAMSIEMGTPKLLAQREVFGFDHSQVGAKLALHWKFSDVFCKAIEQQLHPLSFDPPSAEAVLIRLAVFAHLACQADLSAKVIVDRFPSSLLDHLQLNKVGLVEEFSGMIEEADALSRLMSI